MRPHELQGKTKIASSRALLNGAQRWFHLRDPEPLALLLSSHSQPRISFVVAYSFVRTPSALSLAFLQKHNKCRITHHPTANHPATSPSSMFRVANSVLGEGRLPKQKACSLLSTPIVKETSDCKSEAAALQARHTSTFRPHMQHLPQVRSSICKLVVILELPAGKEGQKVPECSMRCLEVGANNHVLSPSQPQDPRMLHLGYP